MGSVIDYEKCPRCGGILSTEFNYKTFEEWKSCSRCGRREGWSYLRDENGAVILGDDGTPQKEIEDIPGFGAAYLQFDTIGVCYPLMKPDDTELKKAFYEELQNNNNLIKERCYLTVWDDATGDVKAEYGALPETFDDFEKSHANDGSEEEGDTPNV